MSALALIFVISCKVIHKHLLSIPSRNQIPHLQEKFNRLKILDEFKFWITKY